MTYTIDDVGDPPGKFLTVVQKQAIAAEWNANEAGAALRAWQEEMTVSDSTMPRIVEDIMDAMTERDNVAPETLAKYTAKKALRAKMPV